MLVTVMLAILITNKNNGYDRAFFHYAYSFMKTVQ